MYKEKFSELKRKRTGYKIKKKAKKVIMLQNTKRRGRGKHRRQKEREYVIKEIKNDQRQLRCKIR